MRYGRSSSKRILAILHHRLRRNRHRHHNKGLQQLHCTGSDDDSGMGAGNTNGRECDLQQQPKHLWEHLLRFVAVLCSGWAVRRGRRHIDPLQLILCSPASNFLGYYHRRWNCNYDRTFRRRLSNWNSCWGHNC